jgi:hypothetical protein
VSLLAGISGQMLREKIVRKAVGGAVGKKADFVPLLYVVYQLFKTAFFRLKIPRFLHK